MQQRVEGHLAVLRPEGRLTIETHGLLRAAVRDHVSAGRVKLVVDVTDVPYVDSIGVAEIVRSHTIAERAGGRVVLCGVGDAVRELLSLTRLDRVIEMAPSVFEARRRLAEEGT